MTYTKTDAAADLTRLIADLPERPGPAPKREIRFFDPRRVFVDFTDVDKTIEKAAQDINRSIAALSHAPPIFTPAKFADIQRALYRVGQAAVTVRGFGAPSRHYHPGRLRYQHYGTYTHGTVFNVTRGRSVDIGQIVRMTDGRYHIYPRGDYWPAGAFTSMRAALRALGCLP